MDSSSSSSSSSSSRTCKSNTNSTRVYFQIRSISPSGRFCSSSNLISQSSSARSVSSSSIRFSTSPHKQKNNNNNSIRGGQKKTYCMCSPTTHPGSFRCSLHKATVAGGDQRRRRRHQQHQTVSYHSHWLDARRWAMTNSLVRIGTAEGDLVKRALPALIRPSSHQQKRRPDFQPCPTRLSVMSKAQDG